MAVEAVAREASDFIGKPFEVAAVVALLRRYVEARKEADISAAQEEESVSSDLAHSGLVGRAVPMIVVYKPDGAGGPQREPRC